MTPQPASPAKQDKLVRIARFPGLRTLAWSEDWLYASRRYELLKAQIRTRPTPDAPLQPQWQSVGTFAPGLKRKLSVTTNLTARLFRDGFHALATLPSGGLVAAVPGAIVTLRPNETEFRPSHRIMRGTRPLRIAVTPGGALYWGEYFGNEFRDEVHIYGSIDGGTTWDVAYTFAKNAVRHVHNIIYDQWQDCLWVLTGDNGDECRILRAACDFSHVDVVLKGHQQARAVAAIPTESGLYFSSDTPLEANFIYRLSRAGSLQQLTAISSSSIYGCRVGSQLFFSTMVEPSEVNLENNVRIYGGDVEGSTWEPLLSWQKDRWPMHYFQYGNAVLPDGHNATSCLALTTVAVQSDDMVTSLYAVNP